MAGGAQVDVPVGLDQLKQIPYLLLALVMAPSVSSDETIRHFIAQPISGSGHDAHMLRQEPHFFVQFSEHGLFRAFAPVNAALRKLPTVGSDALAPKHLIFLVEQNDADVRPKAFAVKHNQIPNF